MTLEEESAVGLAVELPDSSAVIAITTAGLIMWEHSKLSGQPTSYKMSRPIDELVAGRTEPARMLHGLLLGFRDASAELYEAPRSPRIQNFPAALAASSADRATRTPPGKVLRP